MFTLDDIALIAAYPEHTRVYLKSGDSRAMICSCGDESYYIFMRPYQDSRLYVETDTATQRAIQRALGHVDEYGLYYYLQARSAALGISWKEVLYNIKGIGFKRAEKIMWILQEAGLR